jgi:hypothetical protein
MSIQKVVTTQFKTSDGKAWDDKSAAKAHENRLHAMGELQRALAESCKTGRPEAVLQQMLVEAPMVNAILRGYLKRQPKQEIETEPVLNKAA